MCTLQNGSGSLAEPILLYKWLKAFTSVTSVTFVLKINFQVALKILNGRLKPDLISMTCDSMDFERDIFTKHSRGISSVKD